MHFGLRSFAWGLALGVCGGVLRAAHAPGVSPDGLWVDVPKLQSLAASNVWVNPPVFRSVALDHAGMKTLLSTAPQENAGIPLVVWLPMPDGSFGRFGVSEASVMAPELQALFPDIRTYVGQGLDDGAATLRLDLTPAGLHAQVLSPNGAAYIDKHTRDAGVYAAYWKRDHARVADDFRCMVKGDERAALQSTGPPSLQSLSIGGKLLTYRMACAATGEFTQFHGGTNATVADGLAAVVTTINRVSGILETEVAIRLSLVANNHLLIYTNGATDPYTNNDGNLLIGENQTNTDLIIGDANYDIGHIVGTGGGGLAGSGVCETGWKAGGQTGSSLPVGDAFDVDYVAHEVGHQFNGNHTFNSTNGSCLGNRNASTAFEKGSGSTILSYAGICGAANNLQSLVDPFYHSISYDEMVSYTRLGLANTCPTITLTTNGAPIVQPVPSYVIPLSTPFVLTASATDTNNDVLTYSWEERDLGPAASLTAADNGSSPLFRAFAPTTNPARHFLALTNLLANTTNKGERLPTVGRTMSFRCMVRDNRSSGAGMGMVDTTVIVASNSGPFTVDSFNSGGTFSGRVAVLWNVAGTTGTPVNCSSVTISLSTNGGLTFPFILASAVPNNGSNNVVLPGTNTTQARIKVQGTGNIFFDICNTNFTITPGGVAANVIISSNVLASESCTPTNGRLDAFETVTMNVALRNSGSAPTTNITATLLTNSGIFAISAPQNYGALAPNAAAVSRPFSFTVLATCGTAVTGVLQLADGTNNLGTAYFELPVGGEAATFSENFDGVAAPALPAGWTTSKTGGQSNWMTRTDNADSPPNAAFVPNTTASGVSELVSPSWAVASSDAVMSFRHLYSFEDGYDGGVLEIKIGTNAFTDVLTAGCTFLQNGYDPGTLASGFGNTLAGRAAWSGVSGGFITTRLKFPTNAVGTNVQFRWRCSTDNGVPDAGWWVDSISILDLACCVAAPTADLALTMTRSPANLIASQRVAFVLAVTNNGNATATSVLVSNPVPATAAAVSANGSIGTTTTNAGIIVWNLGSLSNGASASATVLLTALNPAAQIALLTNAATISSSVGDPVATNNTASASAVVYKDSVGDGVPDFWRQQQFGSATTTNATSCATCDADGDGFNNRSEFLADTIPTNAASYLRVSTLAVQTPTQHVFFVTSTGRHYSIEFNNGIQTGLWQLSNGFLPGTGGTNIFASTNAAAPGFFRIKAVLP